MDAVITYVNGLDPIWQKEYAEAVGMDTFLDKRFRDWGTLKYLLRGIQTCMPFIRNVYLVVSSESQVPQWADRDNLHVVLHRDIIPEKFLPVFNSTAIEMFLHRIEGLDEKYLYFNDDFFPMLPMAEEDFFEDGKASIHQASHLFVMGNLFRYHVRNSYRFACKAAGVSPGIFFRRPSHTVAPFFRSQCEELYDSHQEEICASVSPLRERYNLNQYLYADYICLKGLSNGKRISNRHFSLAVAGFDKIVEFIACPSTKLVCINDVKIGQDEFLSFQKRLLGAFEGRFPQKSRFEL